MRSRRRPTTDAIESAREDIEQDDEANDADDTARNAKEFFRRNTCEVIKRMQQPSDPANNIAANLIARYALDPRLRAEARRAIYDAQVTSRRGSRSLMRWTDTCCRVRPWGRYPARDRRGRCPRRV